jgi:hypothetical protein
MTTPAAANAPVMPTTRPRTRGVWPAKEKPCRRDPKKLSPLCSARPERRPLIEGRFQMTIAATRKVTALRYSARSTSLVPGSSSPNRPPSEVSRAKTIAAATGVRP